MAMSTLKEVADRHAVAVLVVHHTRKASADDWVDSVSGTHGLAGAADTVLVLERSRGEADAKLKVTGRDIEEAEYALRFEPARGSWTLLDGPADEYELGETRRRILADVREHGSGTPKVFAERLGLEYENVKKTCQRMAGDGQLRAEGSGVYEVAMTPRRIESTLLVVEDFKGPDGLEYRAGDRVPVQHRSIRRIAAEQPEWFRMEHETSEVDLEWLAGVEAEHEERFKAAKAVRDGAKERRERALRGELKEQERPQPDLERRFKKQKAEREKRKREIGEERERQKLEQDIVLADPASLRGGFHF